MNESCWLIFEHKHLLGKPAENVGWENSFAPIRCVCKSWGFAFLCISCVPFTQILCCFSQRPRSDLITILWLVSPSLLRQKSVPWLCHLFVPESSMVLLSLLVLDLGTQDLCYLTPSHGLYIMSTYFSPLPILCSSSTWLLRVHWTRSPSFMLLWLLFLLPGMSLSSSFIPNSHFSSKA